MQRSIIKEGKSLSPFHSTRPRLANVDGRVIENEIFTSGDVVAIRGRIGAEGRERERVPPREGVAPFLPSFLSFFPWIATGDRGCKTIFNSPLIMNPLMNAPPSLRSRAYLRGSFSSRDLAVYTRTSTFEVNDDGLPGSRATFCFLGCVILAFLFFSFFDLFEEGSEFPRSEMLD